MPSQSNTGCCYRQAEGIYGVTRIPSDKEIKHLKDILHIPEEYAIPCYLAPGYPDESLNKPIP